jgi:hypothetical protein
MCSQQFRAMFHGEPLGRGGASPDNDYGDPELELDPPCPACGSARSSLPLHRPASAKCRSTPPAFSQCGRERDDLADFYADPPTQPGDLPACSSIATPSDKAAQVASIKGDK